MICEKACEVWENGSEALVTETSDRTWIIWICAGKIRLGNTTVQTMSVR
jgi:hypothetical protein